MCGGLGFGGFGEGFALCVCGFQFFGKDLCGFVCFVCEGGFFYACLPFFGLGGEGLGLLHQAFGALAGFVSGEFGCAVSAVGFQKGEAGLPCGVLFFVQAA